MLFAYFRSLLIRPALRRCESDSANLKNVSTNKNYAKVPFFQPSPHTKVVRALKTVTASGILSSSAKRAIADPMARF